MVALGSASLVERVDETEEVEEVKASRGIAIRAGVGGVEEVDEADKVEEVCSAVRVAVAVARRAAPAGDVRGRFAAGGVEGAGDVEIAAEGEQVVGPGILPAQAARQPAPS